MRKFPFYNQIDAVDCGPACLMMISRYYEKNQSYSKVKNYAQVDILGTSLSSLSQAAERLGFRSMIVRVPFSKLETEKPLPCIALWGEDHYVVIYKITKRKVTIGDPASGIIVLPREEFEVAWKQNDETGFLLLLNPTQEFFEQEEGDRKTYRLTSFLHYMKPYRSLMIQILMTQVISTILLAAGPLLTKSLIDDGVNNSDLGFITIILFAQLSVFLGRAAVDFIRKYIYINISSRFSITAISDFLKKLMSLPLAYFEAKHLGDIIERMRDHERIEEFLTYNLLDIFTTLLNLIVLSVLLISFSGKIFFIFILGSGLSISWILLFQKRRKNIDYRLFLRNSESYSSEIQIIQGIQEVKLNNAERFKRSYWEKVQTSLFRINIKSLLLHEYQNTGGNLINEVKNILIIFIMAKDVVSGNISIGILLAVSQIIGQFSGFFPAILTFLRKSQDAKLSNERIREVKEKESEDSPDHIEVSSIASQLKLENITFKYPSQDTPAIKNVSLIIPVNRTTAIVGESGCGKSTLMKLLLKIYEPNTGSILIDNTPLEHVSSTSWRKLCGTVMQDGYIFTDTVKNNIVMEENKFDPEKFNQVLQLTNSLDFVNKLPRRHETKIGDDGIHLSKGQIQRLLLCRALYKSPEIIVLDEATSALDAKNEFDISTKLMLELGDVTKVIIAHRLSTVKNAHNIIVMDDGEIVEQGTHEQLISNQSFYYELVNSQIQ